MKKVILISFILPYLLFSQIRIKDTSFVKILYEIYPKCISMNGYLDTTCALNSSNDSLYISGKNVKDISGIHWFQGIKELGIDSTSIETLPKLPNQLHGLFCVSSNIDSIVYPMPKHLRYAELANNKFSKLRLSFPDSLEVLGLSANPIKSIVGDFPKFLISLDFGGNDLDGVDIKLPNKLKRLEIPGCNLKQLPILPDSLVILEASSNQLERIDKLPLTLKALLVQSNKIESLPTVLPPNLVTLMIRTNRLKVFPKFNRKTINLIEAGGNCFVKPLKNEKTARRRQCPH
jgi:Leucine-rich repeat (LRR) protein